MIHLTAHKGKLEGIPSINTSPSVNPYCRSRAADPSGVCHSCYAVRLSSLRPALSRVLEANSALLSAPLAPADIPAIDGLYARFHSFGELQSSTHADNFAKIAESNPRTCFALWTKRPRLVQRSALPSLLNITLIYSDPILHSSLDDALPSLPAGFHHIYSVFSRASGAVPCGGRCLDCLKCWRKDGPARIRQLLH